MKYLVKVVVESDEPSIFLVDKSVTNALAAHAIPCHILIVEKENKGVGK